MIYYNININIPKKVRSWKYSFKSTQISRRILVLIFSMHTDYFIFFIYLFICNLFRFDLNKHGIEKTFT